MSIKNEENIYKDFFNPDVSEIYKDRFIKIPCEFFTYLQWDDKLFLTLLSLLKRKTIYNTTILCLKDIITENNYIPAKGKNRSIEQFKDSLFNLFTLGLIEFCSSKLQQIIEEQKEFEIQNKKSKVQYTSEYENLRNSITANTVLALRFNENQLEILTSKNFTKLEFNVFFTLKKFCSQNSSVKMANLINTYIVIKKYIEANNQFSKQPWNISIERLSQTLNLSNKTIINIIKVLEDNKILFVNKKDGKNYYSLTETKLPKGTWLQK